LHAADLWNFVNAPGQSRTAAVLQSDQQIW
jgi:hypothetical protein